MVNLKNLKVGDRLRDLPPSSWALRSARGSAGSS